MKLKDIGQPFLISLIIALVYLYSFIPNLGRPVELARNDTFHPIFTLKHYMTVISQGNLDEILTLRNNFT